MCRRGLQQPQTGSGAETRVWSQRASRVRTMGDRMQKSLERATQRNETAREEWTTQPWPRHTQQPNTNSGQSSVSRTRAFLCGHGSCGPPRLAGRPPSCASRGPAIISGPGEGSLYRDGSSCRCRNEPPTPRRSYGVCRCWCAPFPAGSSSCGRDRLSIARRSSHCVSPVRWARVSDGRVPGDAPDFHLHAVVGNVLTRRERTNRCGQDLAHLRYERVRAKDRLRHRQEPLPQCFPHARAEMSLFLTRSVVLPLTHNPSGMFY